MNTSTIPSWVAETSRSHNRGLLVCIEASMIATGTAIAYVFLKMISVLAEVNARTLCQILVRGAAACHRHRDGGCRMVDFPRS